VTRAFFTMGPQAAPNPGLAALALIAIATLGAACGPPKPAALPDLPPPEYETPRGYDMDGPKAPAGAPSAAPQAPAAAPQPSASPPKR
jgi:hypothetical protein